MSLTDLDTHVRKCSKHSIFYEICGRWERWPLIKLQEGFFSSFELWLVCLYLLAWFCQVAHRMQSLTWNSGRRFLRFAMSNSKISRSFAGECMGRSKRLHLPLRHNFSCKLQTPLHGKLCVLFLAMITIFVWHDLQGESNYAICKCCQYLAHGLGCEKKQGQRATEKLILLIDIYTSSSLQSKVRKEFSDAYRGTVCEGSQNLVHWILCLLFMLETVVAAECITKIRSRAFSDPEGSTFGISNGTLVLLAKYAITLNIKLVDSIWTPLSTWLSKKKNWRTETDLKANMVVKLFAVKFVVFYYPFAFTIFVQPYEAEGCDGGEMSGRMHVWQLQTHASTAFLQIHQIPWGHCLLDSNDQRKFACDSSLALSECLRWLHTSRDYPRHGKLAELGCGKWIAHRAPLKDQKVPAAAFLFHTAARLRVKVEIRPLFFLRLPSTSDAIAETIGMQRPSSREASVHLSSHHWEEKHRNSAVFAISSDFKIHHYRFWWMAPLQPLLAPLISRNGRWARLALRVGCSKSVMNWDILACCKLWSLVHWWGGYRSSWPLRDTAVGVLERAFGKEKDQILGKVKAMSSTAKLHGIFWPSPDQHENIWKQSKCSATGYAKQVKKAAESTSPTWSCRCNSIDLTCCSHGSLCCMWHAANDTISRQSFHLTAKQTKLQTIWILCWSLVSLQCRLPSRIEMRQCRL